MKTKTAFVPMLAIDHGVTDIDFYKNAFGANELWRVCNDDGSVHVAGISIDGALFHLHEAMDNSGVFSPDVVKGVTATIGLMTDDVHAITERAVAAGAILASPVQDYDYGYRQGEIIDPFGHRWIIEKIIDPDVLASGIREFK